MPRNCSWEEVAEPFGFPVGFGGENADPDHRVRLRELGRGFEILPIKRERDLEVLRCKMRRKCKRQSQLSPPGAR